MGEYYLNVGGQEFKVTAESREEAISKAQSWQADNQGPSEEELAQQAVNERWNSLIDTTPTEPRPRKVARPHPRLGRRPTPLPTQEDPDTQLKAENAASAGVDTTTGLRKGIRGATGLLSFNKPAQAAAVESALREEYGSLEIPEGVPLVFEDESTGLPMYLRLTEQGKLKPTLINPPGADAGDFVELAGELPTFALETIGGIGGAITGSGFSPGAGTVVGGTAGAAALGAASIPIRVMIAKMAGVDEEILDSIKTGDEAAFQAALSGGGELFGFAVTGAISGLRNFFGRSLEVDDLPALEATIQSNLQKLKALEDRTGQRVDLSVGELSGDPDLLVAEANMMNQQVGRPARQMRAREIAGAKAARQALREMATQKPRAPTDDGFRSAELVSESVRDELSLKPKVELEGVQLRAQNELTQAEQAAKLDSTLDDAYRMRDNIVAHAERMKAAEDLAWDNYRRTVRWDPSTRQSAVLIDNSGDTPIRQVAQRLAADQDNALLGSLRNAYRGTLENMGFSPQQVDEMVASDQLAGLSQQALDPFHLHMALSHMKKELRLLNAGDSSRGWEATDLAEIIEAIEDTMKGAPYISRATGRPVADTTRANVRAAWVDANDTTFKLHNLLDTKNMRYLLETRVKVGPDGTRYELPNMPAGLLRNRILSPNDPRFLIEAVEAVGYDPRIRVALINELRKKHVDATIVGGKWNQTAHNKFVSDYEDHMRFLGIEQDIDNVAQFGRQFDEKANELKLLESKLGQMYGRNVADPTKPLNIADEILSNRVTYRQAKQMMSDLDRVDSRLANEVREKVFEKLDLDLTSSNNLIMNSGKLTEVLRTNRSTLEAVAGRQYVKDLDVLADVLKLTDERVFRKGTKELLQTHFVAITRSLFGPLSKKQRFLTAVQRVARNHRAGSVTDLLRDPNALRQFVRLRNLSVRDPRYWITVRGLGLTEFALDGDDKAQQAYQDFMDGTLQEEQIERETPRRYGSNL